MRRQKAQSLEILECSCGDLSSLVLNSLSLKGELVFMHTQYNRKSKEKTQLMSSQRQMSTIKTKAAKEGCKFGKEPSSPTENYRHQQWTQWLQFWNGLDRIRRNSNIGIVPPSLLLF